MLISSSNQNRGCGVVVSSEGRVSNSERSQAIWLVTLKVASSRFF